jgi:hypothetical protein
MKGFALRRNNFSQDKPKKGDGLAILGVAPVVLSKPVALVRVPEQKPEKENNCGKHENHIEIPPYKNA